MIGAQMCGLKLMGSVTTYSFKGQLKFICLRVLEGAVMHMNDTKKHSKHEETINQNNFGEIDC